LSLISRYVFREVFGAWLVVVAVLFAILMSNQFAEILGEAATDELPKDAVFAIFALTSMSYLTALTPIALFLGILLALARLHRDCEMAALSSCGVGPGRLLRPIGALTIALVAGVSWLALAETPDATQRIEEIKFRAKEAMQLEVIEPGRFTSPDSGDTVLYAREVAGDEIRGVFLQRQQGSRVVAIVADRGVRMLDPSTGHLTFVLYDGRRYEGAPGENRFVIAEFTEHGIPVRANDDVESVEVVAAKSTAELLASAAPVDRAELQWRLSIPLQVLVLAVLAVPLSQSSPREGRYGRIGAGLLIYITYANLLSIARVWVERDQVAAWVGMWWVHAAFAAIGLVLLARAGGWLARSPLVAMPAAS
jgi:lipopolysaccharide export system permease protein